MGRRCEMLGVLTIMGLFLVLPCHTDAFEVDSLTTVFRAGYGWAGAPIDIGSVFSDSISTITYQARTMSFCTFVSYKAWRAGFVNRTIRYEENLRAVRYEDHFGGISKTIQKKAYIARLYTGQGVTWGIGLSGCLEYTFFHSPYFLDELQEDGYTFGGGGIIGMADWALPIRHPVRWEVHTAVYPVARWHFFADTISLHPKRTYWGCGLATNANLQVSLPFLWGIRLHCGYEYEHFVAYESTLFQSLRHFYFGVLIVL